MPSIDDTLPRSSTVPRPRRRSRFERWAFDEITSFRIGLTAGYIGITYYATTALIAGVPAFKIAAPEGWTPVWATAAILAGVTATIGSVRDSKAFRTVELIGAWGMFLALGGYAAVLLLIGYGSDDLGRQSVGAGFVALSVYPGFRMVWLMTRIRVGRRRR